MTDTEQRAAARQFIANWQGKQVRGGTNEDVPDIDGGGQTHLELRIHG